MTEQGVIEWMEAYYASHRSPMAGTAFYNVALARQHGIAISLSFAVARAETNCATDPNMSPPDVPGHNAWGYGHPPGAPHGHVFASWPDGISAVSQWMGEEYVYKGLNTVALMCDKWVGQHSPQWIEVVSDTMTVLGGNPDKLARSFLAKSP